MEDIKPSLEALKEIAPGKPKPVKKRTVVEETKFERDHKIVRGRFKFYEQPGQALKFSFRKYQEDPVKTYTIKDNEILELPRMVAEHLNSLVHMVHQYMYDENGHHTQRVGERIPRCAFMPLDFVDVGEQHGPSIVLVENR